MRALSHLVLLAALAGLAASPTLAQPTGVLVHDSGGDSFHGGVALSNPLGATPNTVAITPTLNRDTGQFADSLEGLPAVGMKSDYGSMSPTGRMAFHANWIDWNAAQGETLLYAQDRDGTNRIRLTDTTTASYEPTPRNEVRDFRPVVSPDGQRVAFLSTRFQGKDANGVPISGEINAFTVPAAGGAMQQVTSAQFVTLNSNGQVATCAGISQVAWSPDGRRLAYIGNRVALDANGDPSGEGCESQVGTMRPNGTDIRVLRGNRANPSYLPSGQMLKWTEASILYYDTRTRAFEIMSANGGEIRQVPFQDTIDDVTLSLAHGWALSPDGQYLATTAIDGPEAYPIVLDLNLTIVERLTTVPSAGTRPMDWVAAPSVPTADRIELANRPSLIWGGVRAPLQPTLYDASGNVIVVGAWHWSRSMNNAFSSRIDRFSGVLHGNDENQLGATLCASNGGLEACVTIDNVHTPIVTAEATDAEAAEDGRDPGRIVVQRYGNPTVEVDAELAYSGSAQLFRDYTASEPGPLLRLPSGRALRTEEVTIVPVDDALEEPTETAILRITCPQGSHCVLGTNLVRATVDILSNGAGSGVGIASSRPETGQTGSLVTLAVSGQGFGDDATVMLTGPASIAASAEFVRGDGTLLYAQFNLNEAPLGTYELAVASGGGEATLASALQVIDDGKAEPWATVLPQFHVGSFPSRQRVVYGNRGDADAYMVPLFVSVGTEATIEMRSEIVLPPDLSPAMAAAFEPYLRPDSLFTTVEQCLPPAAGVVGVAASADCAQRVSMQVAMFVIPIIPAGSSGTLEFSIRVDGSTEPLPIGVAISPIGLSEALERSGISGTECSTPDLSHASGSFRDTPDNPTAHQIGSACLSCMLAAGGVALEFVPGANCLEVGLLAIAGATSNLLESGLAGFGETSVAMGGAGSLAGGLSAMTECAGSLFPPARLAAAAAEAVSLVAKVVSTGIGSAGALTGCVECASHLFWEYYYSWWARSFDPNIKLGPPGVGAEGYVQSLAAVPYQVLFENLPDATASAREVTVVDTLDTSVFDLSTFQLGPITIPDMTVTPPPGLRTWTTYVDRRPEQPSLLRFDAHLDTETGIARWVISDLDPTTFRYREDPGAGFLPPEGEGFVSFTVDPVPDLPNGTTLANVASIRFDREDWIFTPPWANTLDFGAPSSRVTDVDPDPAASDTSYVVTLSASDDGSGVQRTALYTSEDDGPFVLWGVTTENEIRFEAQPGRRYGFFSIALDWAGNSEGLKTEAEVTLGGAVVGESDPTLPEVVELAAPYPNPTRAGAVVQFGLPRAAHTEVRVFDTRGREVTRLVEEERAPGWHRLPWQPDALAPGVYLVRLVADGETRIQRLTVVR